MDEHAWHEPPVPWDVSRQVLDLHCPPALRAARGRLVSVLRRRNTASSRESCAYVLAQHREGDFAEAREQERFSVVWFVAGLGMLAGAIFPGLLTAVADLMGVRDTNVALFSIILLLLLGLALNFSVIMSRQAAQITRLAQERALEKAREQERS